MTNERDEILMSQLADGELAGDQANELLLNVLDDAAGRERLKQMLRLRQTTVGWRNRRPERPILAAVDRPGAFRRDRVAWRMGGLAVAACVGGLLVLAGIWAVGGIGNSVRPAHPWQIASGPVVPLPVAPVTPEQMQQVAKVFALHESVAGPLAWYAADDQTIRVASARGTEGGRMPIAVLLKLDPMNPGAAAQTLVIVCREQQPAVIELPSESPDRSGLRIYLVPRTVNGKVEMQYAIAADGDSSQAVQSSIAGQRRIGLTETLLGQLALGDKLLNVEATAWPMR